MIPDQTLEPGEDYWFLAFGYFSDPDRDRLTYEAETSNSGVATVTVARSRVTIEAVAEGSATITVRAVDPDGLAAEQDVGVTVQSEESDNRAPRATGTIGGRTIDAGSSLTVDVSSNFSDPDDDALGYTATTSNSSVATATVSDTRVTIRGVARGAATITVTARDPAGCRPAQDRRHRPQPRAHGAFHPCASRRPRWYGGRGGCPHTFRIRMVTDSPTRVRQATRAWLRRAWWAAR